MGEERESIIGVIWWSIILIIWGSIIVGRREYNTYYMGLLI